MVKVWSNPPYLHNMHTKVTQLTASALKHVVKVWSNTILAAFFSASVLALWLLFSAFVWHASVWAYVRAWHASVYGMRQYVS